MCWQRQVGFSLHQGLQGTRGRGPRLSSLCEDRIVLSRCAGAEKNKSLHLCRSLFCLFSEQDVEVQEAECVVYGHMVSSSVETGAWVRSPLPVTPLGSCVPLILRPPPLPWLRPTVKSCDSPAGPHCCTH